MIKSFRGKLADGEVQQIRLSTRDGLLGYKIVKFELMPTAPGTAHVESVVKVFTTNTDTTGAIRTASATVDFSDPTLVAVNYFIDNPGTNVPTSVATIIDTMTFNQDITITHEEVNGSEGINYLLELEQVKLSKDEATVATLKDMRAGPDTNFGP